MNRLKYQLTKPCINNAEVRAVQRVFESGWLAEGAVTLAFERKVADYVGGKHAVATSNCTIALELCLKAQDIKGEVVVPDFTHMATIQAVINAGANPTLADVNLESYNLADNPHLLGGYAIPTSWGGNPIKYKQAVVEDAACSLGSEIDGERMGENQIKCFSFHPHKLVTTGEGGMIITNDTELAQRLRDMKNFGYGGGNYKFDDVRAAIGFVQMDKLEGIIEKRIHMAKVYDDLLRTSHDIQPPHKVDGSRHTYQTYAVYLKKGNRNMIIRKLAEKDIETQRGAYALHLLPDFEDYKRIGDLSNSELLHHNLLALPMAYDLTEEDQKFVVDELAKACNN